MTPTSPPIINRHDNKNVATQGGHLMISLIGLNSQRIELMGLRLVSCGGGAYGVEVGDQAVELSLRHMALKKRFTKAISQEPLSGFTVDNTSPGKDREDLRAGGGQAFT
jgi:hypothetical protein